MTERMLPPETDTTTTETPKPRTKATKPWETGFKPQFRLTVQQPQTMYTMMTLTLTMKTMPKMTKTRMKPWRSKKMKMTATFHL